MRELLATGFVVGFLAVYAVVFTALAYWTLRNWIKQGDKTRSTKSISLPLESAQTSDRTRNAA